MENASKALLIAGAILIVILLISLGIYIYSQAQQQIDAVNMDEQQVLAFNNKFAPYLGNNITGSQVNMDEQQVLAFNNKFAPYLGNNITGSQVNALLQQVQASNSQATKMGYTSIDLEGDIDSVTERADTGKAYTVIPEYSSETGTISQITINEGADNTGTAGAGDTE